MAGAFATPTIHQLFMDRSISSNHPHPSFLGNIAARASARRSNHIIPEVAESGSWRQHTMLVGTSKTGKPDIGVNSDLSIRITS